ncbi:Abi family protein [Lentimicrobium sp. L6]|uniref:Abi family protein n=1 Tax=Lentimicrobium sp. L6 TaxID=2735916 RepID=UPI0015551E9A|nr:Abi family protein [Lentimicrobium sp. L6]NPD86375.1 Abi family protein [Lentimicrobium sp. L6]
MAKEPKTIQEQIELLSQRGMLFHDINQAPHYLANISYYRLKGYWWEMQQDFEKHTFKPDTYFENIIDNYNFDRNFRILVFNAIERIEVSLRTKLIYHMSLDYGAHWFVNQSLFTDPFNHSIFLSKLNREMLSSSEEFMKKHYGNHKNEVPESWKALEIVTLGTLSKLYKNINTQLPAKSRITNELGINSAKDLASWLSAITLIRNIIAHHSRLWNRAIITKYKWPKSTRFPLLDYTPDDQRRKKIFPILCAMIYLNDRISPGHHLKKELQELFHDFPSIPKYKLGFPPDWQEQPLFKNFY